MTPLEKSNQAAKDVALIAQRAIDQIIELRKATQVAYEKGFVDGMSEQIRRSVEKKMKEKNNG